MERLQAQGTVQSEDYLPADDYLAHFTNIKFPTRCRVMSPFHIREANQNDVLGMAKVRVETWRDAYKGILPDDFLQGLSVQGIAERWKGAFWEERAPGVGVFVAEDEHKEVVGIAICGPEGSQDPIYQGEIYVLYVHPQNQNQGIGRALVAECLRHLLHELKVETMLVWVMADNPYRRFYEALGGKVVREKTKEIGGRTISEVGYGWEGIPKLAFQAKGPPALAGT